MERTEQKKAEPMIAENGTTTDNKRLQSTLKRIGVTTTIPLIEEVNIFKGDTIIQFLNPKVQASCIGANTWVVTGSPQTKSLKNILPAIINHLGRDNLDILRKLAAQFQKQATVADADEGVVATSTQEDDDDDEEVPEAEEGQKS